jgi:hypothetical protein
MVRPERFELPAFWFVAARTTLPNLARGVANRANSASWDNFAQTVFSFFYRHLLHNCRCFPPFALHFRDSAPFRSIVLTLISQNPELGYFMGRAKRVPVEKPLF